MNEQLPCTTSTALQTVNELLYLFALILAPALILFVA
jgi:hypothetical protein